MKLLIITQKVNENDPILGFFVQWINEFIKISDKVTVVCLEVGKHNLPIRVLSLGKEREVGKLGRVCNLYKYVWRFRKDYDVVFVHMNPIYVCLAGIIFKFLNKKIFLWYTHKMVDLKLKVAGIFSKNIFSATSDSIKLRSGKIVVTGHGIDTDLFKPELLNKIEKRIITVSRISSAKKIYHMLPLMSYLDGYQLEIIGVPVTKDDFSYFEKVKQRINELGISDKVIFSGPINNMDLPNKYNSANIFLNFSSGSLDKSILEAMSCGLNVITSNQSLDSNDGVIHVSESDIEKDTAKILEKIKNISDCSINTKARDYVVNNHSLRILVPKLLSLMTK